MSKPDESCCHIDAEDSTRHQWISVAAYFKAARRDFQQGKELDDWLEAENEYTECQIRTFLTRCEEDGDMTISGLQKLACSVGVSNARDISNEVDLIREIQKTTQHRPCFRTTYQQPCEEPESDCPWRAECKKIIAVWCR